MLLRTVARMRWDFWVGPISIFAASKEFFTTKSRSSIGCWEKLGSKHHRSDQKKQAAWTTDAARPITFAHPFYRRILTSNCHARPFPV
ncbi:MAG: hypothetical protein ACHRHE_24155 [Tepidisphaerales bacterium]